MCSHDLLVWAPVIGFRTHADPVRSPAEVSSSYEFGGAGTIQHGTAMLYNVYSFNRLLLRPYCVLGPTLATRDRVTSKTDVAHVRYEAHSPYSPV